MVCQENSELSSLPDSALDETSQRCSQVVSASRNQRAPKLELVEQPMDGAELEQLRVALAAHLAPQKVIGDWTYDDLSALARVGGRLLTPSRASLPPDSTSSPSGQHPKIDHQKPPHEQRVARLERQRRQLSALVGTLLVGATALYAMVLRPEIGRQEQMITQLYRVNAKQRTDHERERGRLTSRISELDARFAGIQTKLDAARQPNTTQLLPVLVVPNTPPSQPQSALTPGNAPQTVVASEAEQVAAASEAQEALASAEASQAAAVNEAPQSAAVNEAPQSAASPETPKTPSLMEAMKSAVSKKASRANTSTGSGATVKTGCDKNDPLCGDLS